MPTMQLKPRHMDPRTRDDISEALAYMEYPKDADGQLSGAKPYRVVPPYFHNQYFPELRARTYGPHAKKTPPVSRFYPTTDPPTVVDFQPPSPEPWFDVEKREYCVEQGYAYVPIELGAKLTPEQFAARLKDARAVTAQGHQRYREAQALASAEDVEGQVADPTLLHLIDRAALRYAEEYRGKDGRPIKGTARDKVVARRKQELVDYYRERLKNGRMDLARCYRDLADPSA